MKNYRKIIALLLTAVLLLAACACGQVPTNNSSAPENSSNTEPVPDGGDKPAEKNGDIYILFTSDVHCGVDQGFGYAGLMQIRKTLEDQGCTTILVDDGDAIQGETLGTLTRGEAVLDLMNMMKYDVVTIGNHEFDYGMERFLELAEKAEFPYVSCNFNKQRELVFKPYVIIEATAISRRRRA